MIKTVKPQNILQILLFSIKEISDKHQFVKLPFGHVEEIFFLLIFMQDKEFVTRFVTACT